MFPRYEPHPAKTLGWSTPRVSMVSSYPLSLFGFGVALAEGFEEDYAGGD